MGSSLPGDEVAGLAAPPPPVPVTVCGRCDDGIVPCRLHTGAMEPACFACWNGEPCPDCQPELAWPLHAFTEPPRSVAVFSSGPGTLLVTRPTGEVHEVAVEGCTLFGRYDAEARPAIQRLAETFREFTLTLEATVPHWQRLVAMLTGGQSPRMARRRWETLVRADRRHQVAELRAARGPAARLPRHRGRR